MKIVRNNIIPFKGFKAVNLFGVLFVRKDAVIGSVDINHEAIHSEQMKETLYVGFYLWYAVEWLVRFLLTFDAHKAYRGISFEKEAYACQQDMGYLGRRKRYSWVKFI